MGEFCFLWKQSAEIGGSRFLGWGIFGTEPADLGCVFGWGQGFTAALLQRSLRWGSRTVPAEENSCSFALVPSLCTHAHVQTHTLCTDTAHGETFEQSDTLKSMFNVLCFGGCFFFFLKQPDLKMCLVGCHYLLTSNGRGGDWECTYSLALFLSQFLCYQRFT